MDRIKENEIYDKFQDLCNSHKEISHYGDKHICNTECPLRDTNRCENVFFYQQGKADGFQEALTSNGINIYVDKIEADGVKEFAEWLPQHFDLRFSNNPDVWIDEYFNHTRDKVLAEWKKGEENESIDT